MSIVSKSHVMLSFSDAIREGQCATIKASLPHGTFPTSVGSHDDSWTLLLFEYGAQRISFSETSGSLSQPIKLELKYDRNVKECSLVVRNDAKASRKFAGVMFVWKAAS